MNFEMNNYANLTQFYTTYLYAVLHTSLKIIFFENSSSTSYIRNIRHCVKKDFEKFQALETMYYQF